MADKEHDYNQGTYNGRDQSTLDKILDTQNILENVIPVGGSEEERNESRLNDLVDEDYKRPLKHTVKEQGVNVINHALPILMGYAAKKLTQRGLNKALTAIGSKAQPYVRDLMYSSKKIHKNPLEKADETAKSAKELAKGIYKEFSGEVNNYPRQLLREEVDDLKGIKDVVNKTKNGKDDPLVKAIKKDYDIYRDSAKGLARDAKKIRGLENSHDPVYRVIRALKMPEEFTEPLYKVLDDVAYNIEEQVAREKYMTYTKPKVVRSYENGTGRFTERIVDETKKRSLSNARKMAKKDPETVKRLEEFVNSKDFRDELARFTGGRLGSEIESKSLARGFEAGVSPILIGYAKHKLDNKKTDKTGAWDPETVRPYDDPSLEMTKGQKMFDNLKSIFDVNFSDNPRMYDMDVVDYLINEVNNTKPKWAQSQLDGLSDVEKIRFLRRISKGAYDNDNISYSDILKNIYYANKKEREGNK